MKRTRRVLRRRRHTCTSCAHVVARPLVCDLPCPRCGGRMLLGGRDPAGGRPRLDMVKKRISLPRAWVECIGPGKLQQFVRDAVEAKLIGE